MTLVSIVGDFYSNVLPIFYHFKDEISNHIIIYDDYKQDTLHAKKIIQGTKDFIEKYNLPIVTHTKQIDEDSYVRLESVSEYILEFQARGEAVLVNITDGLAAVTFTLINRLEPYGIKFLSYDRFDNTYTALHPQGMTAPLKVTSISIEDHFLLKNIELKTRTSEENAHIHEKDLKLFFEQCNSDKEFFEHKNSFITQTPVGLLYELYVFNLVKQLSYDDIAIGVKVQDNYDGDAFENEFDILVMKNNHLHMIECKARDDYEQSSVSSFIYKLDSVRSTLDDDANMIFLTQDPVYDPFMDSEIKNRLSPYHRANARRVFLRGSPVGRVERFLRDVDSIFSLETENIDELSPIEMLPVTNTSEQKKRINEHFQERSGLKLNFFNRTVLSKLFNYKIVYMTDKKVHAMMKVSEVKILFKKISRMKDDAEMQVIYNYFVFNILETN